MKFTSLILAFLVGALIAGGGTYFLVHGQASGDSEPIARAPGDALEAAPGVDVDAPLVAEEPADPTLRGAPGAAAHVAELEQQNRLLETEVAGLIEKLEQIQPKPRDPRAFRFGIPEAAASFDQAPWPELSEHMGALVDLLDELKTDVVAGKDPGPGQIAKIVKHNTPLAEFAVRFGADLDDEHMANANGAYTHPAVIANLIRASLAGAGKPLSADQEIAIQALGDAWLGEHERTVASIPADAPLLKHTVLEVDAKLRFLASVKSVLTGEQRETLFNPATEGRLKLDLLSPALVYVLSYPVESLDQADMESKLVSKLFEQAGIELEDLSSFAWVGREWVDAVPGATNPKPSRSVDLIFPHVDQVQMRARAQVQAIERILAMGGVTEEQAEQLRAVSYLLYPYVIQTSGG